MVDDMDIDEIDSKLETSSKTPFAIYEFDPMTVEYNISEEEIQSCKKRVMQTLFPRNEFKNNEERERYALKWHKHYQCASLPELIHSIAIKHITTRYCHWCRDYDVEKTIIEHKHIKGNAGRYRGVLCRRCNVIEGHLKHLSHQDKIDHLYHKIGDKVYHDYNWIKQCIDNWYN